MIILAKEGAVFLAIILYGVSIEEPRNGVVFCLSKHSNNEGVPQAFFSYTAKVNLNYLCLGAMNTI